MEQESFDLERALAEFSKSEQLSSDEIAEVRALVGECLAEGMSEEQAMAEAVRSTAATRASAPDLPMDEIQLRRRARNRWKLFWGGVVALLAWLVCVGVVVLQPKEFRAAQTWELRLLDSDAASDRAELVAVLEGPTLLQKVIPLGSPQLRLPAGDGPRMLSSGWRLEKRGDHVWEASFTSYWPELSAEALDLFRVTALRELARADNAKRVSAGLPPLERSERLIISGQPAVRRIEPAWLSALRGLGKLALGGAVACWGFVLFGKRPRTA